MSDAKESEWNKAGRPGGSAGMTKGASISSGLSGHEQITKSHDQMGMGHGQGQRPVSNPSTSISRGGKTFRTK